MNSYAARGASEKEQARSVLPSGQSVNNMRNSSGVTRAFRAPDGSGDLR
ncbi:hypothetical protein [Nitratidesulfovibrio liaohensis]|nr:hypothetical protein [Nitratidesulfovibrio liaohensis]